METPGDMETRPQTRPHWGARLRVVGYLLLWVGEVLYQGLQLVGYVLRRRKIRQRIRSLILTAPPTGPKPGNSAAGNA